jgi:HK97 family phage major capsid protein
MKKENELIEELNKLYGNFKDAADQLADERRQFGEATGETQQKVDGLTEKITDLYKQIDDLRAELKAPRAPAVDELDEAQQLHYRAMDKFLRHGRKRMDIFEPEELRALSEASDTDGAFFTPTEMESSILMAASNLAVMRPLVNTGTTSRQAVAEGILSKPIVAWGAENLDIDEQTLEAGINLLNIYDLKALYLVSNDTLDDAEANIIGELSAAFGRVIAEEEDIVIAAGSGFRRPKGFTVDTDIQANYTKTGVAAGLSDGSNNGMDALINCLTALKGTYRVNSTWVFNSATMGLVMQFKDDYGQYLWQPMTQQGAPATLLGRPTAVNEGMPDVGANAFPIALADFRVGYKLRDRSGLTIKRLDERYAEKDQVGFIIKKRLGGKPTLPECYQLVKCEA